MQANFQNALARILVYEGGKVDNPRDPGGRTNMGITQRTYNAWRNHHGMAVRDVYLIATDERDTIYKSEYWDPIHGDELPSGLDLAMFDAAVNSGCGSATMWLQGALGVEADGAFGSKTLVAALACDDEHTLDELCQRRLGSLKRLRTWPTFGRGWEARIANVEKTGDSWAEAATSDGQHPMPVDVTSAGGHQKASMDDLKPPIIAPITAHVVTTASAVSTAATQTAQQLAPAADVIGSIKYVLGGITVVSAVAGVLLLLSKQANDAANNGTAKVKPNLLADEKFPRVDVPITSKKAA